METCTECGAPVFPGATDCDSCGHIVAQRGVAEPRSSGHLLFKLAALVAISPLLPLAVGFLVGVLCGRAPGMDFLCATDGGYSIADQGIILGVFGFLFTVPIGVVLALLGLLRLALTEPDSRPVSAADSGRVAGRRPDAVNAEMGRRRSPSAVATQQSTRSSAAENVRWGLAGLGTVLVVLGVLCFALNVARRVLYVMPWPQPHRGRSYLFDAQRGHTHRLRKWKQRRLESRSCLQFKGSFRRLERCAFTRFGRSIAVSDWTARGTHASEVQADRRNAGCHGRGIGRDLSAE